MGNKGRKAKKRRKNGASLFPLRSAHPSKSFYAHQKLMKLFEGVIPAPNPVARQKN